MENYIVSARKYRPAAFESVVGQGALTATLRNAIRSGHLAHAYLFCGPRGVGKTTCARIFAKTINCQNPTAEHDACNECESCRAFNEQRLFNIHELDAASNNSVDDIRSLIDQVRIPPQVGNYSVYIIDEVHMLSASAFNALLKTLEEPPSYAIFILATTEKHKVLPTILSRCQVFDFSRITLLDIVGHLQYVAKQEGINAEVEALHVVAQKADGGMRDALSIFDQLVTFCGNTISYEQAIKVLNVLDTDYYFRLTDSLLKGDVSGALLLFDEVLNKGFDGGHFVTGFATHLRDVLVSKDAATTVLLEVSEAARKHYAEQAQRCSVKWIFAALDIVNTTDINYRTARNKRLIVELMMVKIAALMIPAQPSAPQPASVPQQKPVSAQPTAAPQRSTVPTASPVSAPAAAPSAGVKAPTIPTVSAPTIPTIPTIPGVPTAPSAGVKASAPTPSAPPPTSPSAPPTNVPFTVEQMADAWNAMRAQLFGTDKRYNAMLSNMAPQHVGGMNYEFVLVNQIQQQEIQAVKPQIMKFLAEKLHNSLFSLQFVVRQEEYEAEAYTSDERYKLLLGINSDLQTLRSSLGLILE